MTIRAFDPKCTLIITLCFDLTGTHKGQNVRNFGDGLSEHASHIEQFRDPSTKRSSTKNLIKKLQSNLKNSYYVEFKIDCDT